MAFIRGEQVVVVRDRLFAERGAAKRIRVDHGLEFIFKVLACRAYESAVVLDLENAKTKIEA